jgi:arylsulfatase A-like enzyme
VKSPCGNEVELDFVRAAVEAEGLGKHADPDILALSLSANDEVGHTFGPYSREVLDMTVQTDRQLGALLRWLDQKAPGYVAVFTADHGASPMPEYMARLGVDAHRIKKAQLKGAVEAALAAKFGDPKLLGEKEWVVGIEDPSIYLNEKLIAAAEGFGKPAREEIERAAAATLTAIPGVLCCYTRSELLRGTPAATPAGRMYQLCFYPQRSGDVFVATKPYSFWGKYAEKDYGDSHGSPYEYDTHVPLAFMGPGIEPGEDAAPVAIADLAPTLAHLLGVNAPPCAEGKVLFRRPR